MDSLPESILERVLALAPAAGGYWVAFSGGLDSRVLLHALATRRDRLPGSLGALHVNHNLQADAAAWAARCRDWAADSGLLYHEHAVHAVAGPGESPEAAARNARYRALAADLPAGHVLLTAHHREDQAETLLLQLLRGAGPKGLAAMPPVCHFGAGTLMRPLLGIGRDRLRAYAQEHRLDWIDDPSNAETGFDRNFLRHDLFPLLQRRWPGVAQVLARGAGHQAEAAQLLDELAELDLHAACGRQQDRLSIAALLRLSPARRANLLRHWLHRQGAATPSAAILARIDQNVLPAAADAVPQVRWAGVCVRRYRDDLFLVREGEGARAAATSSPIVDWPAEQPLVLPGGVLVPIRESGQGVAVRWLDGRRLRVAFRRGGERLRPAGRREHHSLKHLFQDAGVPPWERAQVPLLYLGDALVAVAGHWVVEGFQAVDQEPGIAFSWLPAIVPDRPIW